MSTVAIAVFAFVGSALFGGIALLVVGGIFGEALRKFLGID